MTQIPLIASAADLPSAVEFAQRHSTSRWYVAGRAQAFGQLNTLPDDWAEKGALTAAAKPEDWAKDADVTAAEKAKIDKDVADGHEDELPSSIVDPDNDGDDDLVASKDTDHDGAEYRKKLGLKAAALIEATDYEALTAASYYDDYGVEDAFDEFDLDSELPELGTLVAAASQPFTADQRREYAKKGVALSDGSFPIPNKRYLKKAIRAVGRSSHPASTVRAHIVKRAKALGATSLLPDSYGPVTAASDLGNVIATVNIDARGALDLAKDALRDRVQPTITASAKDALRERVNRGKADGVIVGAELQTITAGRHSAVEDIEHAGHDFEEALHPRGKDGEFISEGGRVVADDGAGHKVEGTVQSFHRSLDGSTQVAVKTDQDHTILTSPSHISEAPKSKASLSPGLHVVPGGTSGKSLSQMSGVELDQARNSHAVAASNIAKSLKQDVHTNGPVNTPERMRQHVALKSERAGHLQAMNTIDQHSYGANTGFHTGANLTPSHTPEHTSGMPTSTLESADTKARREAIEAEQATRSAREQAILDRAGAKGKVDTSHDVNAKLAEDVGGPVTPQLRSDTAKAAEGASDDKKTGQLFKGDTVENSAGQQFKVVSHTGDNVSVKMPSGVQAQVSRSSVARVNKGSEIVRLNPGQSRFAPPTEDAKQALRDRVGPSRAEAQTRGAEIQQLNKLAPTPENLRNESDAQIQDRMSKLDQINPTAHQAIKAEAARRAQLPSHQEAVVEQLKRMGYTDRTAKGARNLTSKDKNTRITVNSNGTFGMKVNNGSGVYSARNHGVDTSGDPNSVAQALHETGRTAPAVKPHAGKPAGSPAVEAARSEVAARADGKVPVYNVETGKVEHVSPDEATAGHVRYGQSLGAGTPAAGQTIKNALDAKTARDRTPEQKQEMIKNAEQMFGSDRSKWTKAQLGQAASLGDVKARKELESRSGKA